MTGNEVRDAALLYCKQVLARTAHYLDCARTDEGWAARVIVVEEKERKGAAEPKRWNMLYEIHLDPGGKPLYHLRLAPWNKALPAPQPEGTPAPRPEETPAPQPEETPAPIEAVSATETQDVARDPDLEGVVGEEATPPPLSQPTGDKERAEPELPPRGEDGSGSSGETLGETPEESLGPALGETPEDIFREALEEVVGDAAGGEEVLTPGIGEAPHPEAGPKRPAVQERQGPPKVSFRFALDDTIKDDTIKDQ